MTGYIAAAFCLFLTGFNLFSLGLAAWRCRRRPEPLAARLTRTGLDNPTPPVSIVRPVCGLETFSEQTLRSTFELDYPDYEVLFCVQKKTDPIIPLIRTLLAEQPEGRGQPADRGRSDQPQPQAQQLFQGLAGGAASMDRARRFQRAGP